MRDLCYELAGARPILIDRHQHDQLLPHAIPHDTMLLPIALTPLMYFCGVCQQRHQGLDTGQSLDEPLAAS
jgi:hypothetical protein